MSKKAEMKNPALSVSRPPEFWVILEGNWAMYLTSILFLAVSAAATAVIPMIGAIAIDTVTEAENNPHVGQVMGLLKRWIGGDAGLRQHFWVAPCAMAALTAVGGIAMFLKSKFSAVCSESIARKLRLMLFEHVSHLPIQVHDQLDTGDLVQRFTSDVDVIRQFLASQVIEIGNVVMLLGVSIPLMYSMHAKLTGCAMALMPVIVIFGYNHFKKIQESYKKLAEAESRITSATQENITGIRTVRAFGRHDYERARFAVHNLSFRDEGVRLQRVVASYWAVSAFTAMTQIGLTLFSGAYWIQQGQLTVGTLFSFLGINALMLWPLRQLGPILTDLGKASIAAARLGEIFRSPREPTAAPIVPLLEEPLKGSVHVRNLSYNYPGGNPVIKDISFEINPGEILAIVGPSGSGKSTLVNVLVGLYPYSSGSIQLDGNELSDLAPDWIRREVGMVTQDPFLFSRSLHDNIRFGSRGSSVPEVTDAAASACIHETILSFKEGYNTMVGERGVTLSGGQRQRLGIARALVKMPRLLVLDDALSALDSETEADLISGLKTRIGVVGIILVAHRLSSVAHATRVLVLEDGRIVQCGSPHELRQREGYFRRWLLSQCGN